MKIAALIAVLMLTACAQETLRASDGKEYKCQQYIGAPLVWWDSCQGSDLATKEYRQIKAGQ